MSKRIKLGTTLIAIDECEMEFVEGVTKGGDKALTIGKEYVVKKVDETGYITIIDDQEEAHGFHKKDIPEFFKIKQ